MQRLANCFATPGGAQEGRPIGGEEVSEGISWGVGWASTVRSTEYAPRCLRCVREVYRVVMKRFCYWGVYWDEVEARKSGS